MSVQLFFLGAPRFRLDGAQVEITAAKAVALLAYLAVTNRPQPRERLLALLWAESAEDAARKNLRNTLWTIRRALGDEAVMSKEDRLVLAPGVWTDLAAFAAAVEAPAADDEPAAIERLQAASSLYGGPFLDGLSVADAPDFELWCIAERERFAQFNLRALTSLTASYRRSGQWHEVLATAQLAIEQDNLQEPMYRVLMEAQARLGDRPAALRQYEALRAVLARELGVEPLPETETLRTAILEQRGGDERSSANGLVRPPAPALKPYASLPPFVGRAAEQAILDGELAAAAGGARVLLMTGEVGIGKSRLWHEWSAGLPRGSGWAILEARCLESTQSLPFAPLAQMLRSPDCLQRAFGAGSRVPRLWLAEIARLLPELRLAHPDLPATAPLPSDEERRRLFEAIVQALLALDAQQLVFFVDDAHWADQTTLDWLGYLVDRLRNRQLLLVLTYRPDEAPGALIRLAAGWARQGLARRLPLARLAEDDGVRLVTLLGIPARLAELIQVQGAGNPYFLIELARAGLAAAGSDDPAATVPPALAELVRARLERLSQPARQVLQAAAVLEPDFDFATLRRASGRGEEEMLDALDELLGAGMLTEDERPAAEQDQQRPGGSQPFTARPPAPRHATFYFAHPLVADIVRDGLSGARRTFLYRRAGEALEATYAGRLPEVAGRLAGAYANAGEPARAAAYAETAAGRALDLGAASEAVAFYRRALALAPTPERQLGLGRALTLQAPPPEARAVLLEALAGFLAGGNRLGAARAALDLASTYLPVGRGDEVLHWAEQSLAYLDTHTHPEADPEAHAQAHFLLGAGRLRMGGSLDEAEDQLAEGARLAEEKGLPGMAARGTFELGNLLAQRGNLPAAINSFHTSIALARAAGDRMQEILGDNNAAYHEVLAGDLAAAHADIAAGLALDEEFDMLLPRQYLYSTRGELALAEQQWDDAESWLRRGLAESERLGNREQIASYQANLALAARGRGDLDAALVLLETARQGAVEFSGRYLQIQIDLWLTELFAQRGELAAAADALRRAETQLDGAGYQRLAAWAAQLRAGGIGSRRRAG